MHNLIILWLLEVGGLALTCEWWDSYLCSVLKWKARTNLDEITCRWKQTLPEPPLQTLTYTPLPLYHYHFTHLYHYTTLHAVTTIPLYTPLPLYHFTHLYHYTTLHAVTTIPLYTLTASRHLQDYFQLPPWCILSQPDVQVWWIFGIASQRWIEGHDGKKISEIPDLTTLSNEHHCEAS
jgi:hypothetical protein